MFTIIAVALFNKKNELLILKKQPNKAQGGKWGLPAGKPEPGENLQQTAIREVKEETGLSVDPALLYYVDRKVFNYKAPGEYAIEVFYVTKALSWQVVINEAEHSEYKWVAYKGLQQVDLIDDTIDIIEYIDKTRRRYES